MSLSKTSLAFRVIGLIIGFTVGLHLYPPGYVYNHSEHWRFEGRTIAASLIVVIFFKALNFLFNDNGDAGMGEYVVGFLAGMICYFFLYTVIPIFV